MIRPALVAGALLAIAWLLPRVRHHVISVVTWSDTKPSEPVQLPPADGPGLAPTPLVRVILIDGLAAETARTLPAWSALCKRGITLTVDVGFPTVSLPVEVALWTGLTQQQTGIVMRSDHPLVPPLDRRGIPAQVPGSFALAENHGWIVRSLGFATVLPAADPMDLVHDANPAAWDSTWQTRAYDAVTSDLRLVFIHVLRVDTAGHKFGRDSTEYRTTAEEADKILGAFVAARSDARWFLLSDHGHLATGGHGGEERSVRQVEACIAGVGVGIGRGELVHIVDIARAIADSVGAKLDPQSRGRPLMAALHAPLAPDQAVPPVPLGRGAVAIAIIAVGLVLSLAGRRWWLAPWWFVIACVTLVVVRGEPTLSMPMVYAPAGRAMYLTWLPALAITLAATWIGLGRTTLARVVVSQLALPFAALAAALTISGCWAVLAGADLAPVVPRYTAWMSALWLMASHGSMAVALAVLGRSVRSVFGRPEPQESGRSAPADG